MDLDKVTVLTHGLPLPQLRSQNGRFGSTTFLTHSSEGSAPSPCPSQPYIIKHLRNYSGTPQQTLHRSLHIIPHPEAPRSLQAPHYGTACFRTSCGSAFGEVWKVILASPRGILKKKEKLFSVTLKSFFLLLLTSRNQKSQWWGNNCCEC